MRDGSYRVDEGTHCARIEVPVLGAVLWECVV